MHQKAANYTLQAFSSPNTTIIELPVCSAKLMKHYHIISVTVYAVRTVVQLQTQMYLLTYTLQMAKNSAATFVTV